jgi:hypothetical protein
LSSNVEDREIFVPDSARLVGRFGSRSDLAGHEIFFLIDVFKKFTKIQFFG